MLLIVFFVPKFEGLFERLERQGNGLPLATVLLLGLSDFLIRYGLLLLAGRGGRRVRDCGICCSSQAGIRFSATIGSCACRSPDRSSTAPRYLAFCRVLGTLLHNGVPILKALEISSGSVGNQLLAEAIRIPPKIFPPGRRSRHRWPTAA